MAKKRSWSDEELKEAVADNFSVAGVLRVLGLRPSGGNYNQIQRKVSELELDNSHWTGKGHLRGKSHTWAPSIPLDEILVEKSTYQNVARLKKRLVSAKMLDGSRCSVCGLSEWLESKIPLQLDHMNGVRDDNRLDNLRLVCPNCHAQTETYCGKNIGVGKRL